MSILPDGIKSDLKMVLAELKDDVNIEFFTQEFECYMCKENRELVYDVAALNDKIKVKVNDFSYDLNRAEELGVDKIPAMVLLDKNNKDNGVKFFGIPAGYELNSLVKSILEVSGVKDDLPEHIMKRIKAIDKPVHIQVFVSLTCPYCPPAVVAAHRLALENEMIKADMVEISTFVYLANKYNITGVPQTIINDTVVIDGAQSLENIIDEIEKL